MNHSFLFYPAIAYFLMKGSILLGLAWTALVVRWHERKYPRELPQAPAKPKETLLEESWYDFLVESGSQNSSSAASAL